MSASNIMRIQVDLTIVFQRLHGDEGIFHLFASDELDEKNVLDILMELCYITSIKSG